MVGYYQARALQVKEPLLLKEEKARSKPCLLTTVTHTWKMMG